MTCSKGLEAQAPNSQTNIPLAHPHHLSNGESEPDWLGLGLF